MMTRLLRISVVAKEFQVVVDVLYVAQIYISQSHSSRVVLKP